MYLPLLLASLGVVALACTATSQVFRLNPGEEPERYRVVCRDSSKQCDRRAKEQCEGEYTVISRQMSRPEQKEIEDSDLSSTGPSEGFVGWRSELVVSCGRELPKLELKRPTEDSTKPAASAVSPAPSAQATAAARVCVPGVTQACLGPGACSGAQACLRDGSGYGVCDCGSPDTSAKAAPSATLSPSAPPPNSPPTH